MPVNPQTAALSRGRAPASSRCDAPPSCATARERCADTSPTCPSTFLFSPGCWPVPARTSSSPSPRRRPEPPCASRARRAAFPTSTTAPISSRTPPRLRACPASSCARLRAWSPLRCVVPAVSSPSPMGSRAAPVTWGRAMSWSSPTGCACPIRWPPAPPRDSPSATVPSLSMRERSPSGWPPRSSSTPSSACERGSGMRASCSWGRGVDGMPSPSARAA